MLEYPVNKLKPEHKCEPIGRAIMSENRDWWVGRLIEKVEEFPEETHCLHFKTPLKDVVFLVNEADMQWLMVLARTAIGPVSERWLGRVTHVARLRATEVEGHNVLG